jgi:hypothetical protein
MTERVWLCWITTNAGSANLQFKFLICAIGFAKDTPVKQRKNGLPGHE